MTDRPWLCVGPVRVIHHFTEAAWEFACFPSSAILESGSRRHGEVTLQLPFKQKWNILMYSLYHGIFLINVTQWCIEIWCHSFSFDGLALLYLNNNSLLRRNVPGACEKPPCLGMTIASCCPLPSPHPVLLPALCCGPSPLLLPFRSSIPPWLIGLSPLIPRRQRENPIRSRKPQLHIHPVLGCQRVLTMGLAFGSDSLDCNFWLCCLLLDSLRLLALSVWASVTSCFKGMVVGPSPEFCCGI